MESIDFESLYKRIQASCPSQLIPILSSSYGISKQIRLLADTGLLVKHVFNTEELDHTHHTHRRRRACYVWGEIDREIIRQRMADWIHYGVAI